MTHNTMISQHSSNSPVLFMIKPHQYLSKPLFHILKTFEIYEEKKQGKKTTND